MTASGKHKILIVGTGCLGSVLAVKLAARHEVFCCDADAGRVREVGRRGIVCLHGRERRVWRGRIESRMSRYKNFVFDGAIFTTKCDDVAEACVSVAKHCAVKRVLFLQNGDFPLGPFAELFPGTGICRAVTTMAAGKKKGGCVEDF
jgi:ketopantoate reductase